MHCPHIWHPNKGFLRAFSLVTINHINGLLFPNTNWASITQEFGTIKSVDVIKALRAENSWTHYGNLENNELLNHWSKKNLLDAFRPQDSKWEQKIVNRGMTLFKQSFVTDKLQI